MPILKYRAKRDIPNAIKQLRSFSPVDIRAWILNRYNKAVTPESISNWKRRHPDVIKSLELELQAEELPMEEIRTSVFETGTFETYPSIHNWIIEMRGRDIVNYRRLVATMKRVCQGVKPRKGIDIKNEGWSMKHPDRFTLDDAKEFVDIMKTNHPDIDISAERMAMRGFLESKGIAVGKKISGAKHKSAGKYARLFVDKEHLYDIFEELKHVNYEAYVVTFFMFKTGTRINATLSARIENIRELKGFNAADIRVYDKGRRSKYPEGKPWDKYVDKALLDEIRVLTGYPEKKAGPTFTLTDIEMSEYNKNAILKVYPQLIEDYPDYEDWNHFWRHMFAQHMLRATGWNYGVVAALGGWDVKSLEESYGKPPIAILREWGRDKIPDL